MMHYNKNKSKIKILKIPIVLIKISETRILDHMYYTVVPQYCLHFCFVNFLAS